MSRDNTITRNFEGKKALLVDDDIDFLEQIDFGVREMGFQTVRAESQAEAEKMIETEQYDVAVFDLMMENEDSGFVLAYKSKKKNPDTPVVIVTSVSNETGMKFDAATEEARDWIRADIMLDKL